MQGSKRPLTSAEEAYLEAHALGRLATVGRDGVPHIVPVAYVWADGTLLISPGPGARNLRNVAGKGQVAFLVDDPPPSKSGITVWGPAERPAGGRALIRLRPEYVASWRIDEIEAAR